MSGRQAPTDASRSDSTAAVIELGCRRLQWSPARSRSSKLGPGRIHAAQFKLVFMSIDLDLLRAGDSVLPLRDSLPGW